MASRLHQLSQVCPLNYIQKYERGLDRVFRNGQSQHFSVTCDIFMPQAANYIPRQLTQLYRISPSWSCCKFLRFYTFSAGSFRISVGLGRISKQLVGNWGCKAANGEAGWTDSGRRGLEFSTSSPDVAAPNRPYKIAISGPTDNSVVGSAVWFTYSLITSDTCSYTMTPRIKLIIQDIWYFSKFCTAWCYACRHIDARVIDILRTFLDYHPDLAISCFPRHDGGTQAVKHWRGLRFEGSLYDKPLIQENTMYVYRSRSILRNVDIK